MPIRAHLRCLYPIDWRELSQFIRFVRAKGRCEGCKRPHGHQVLHCGDGRWWDEEAATWRNGQGRRIKGAAPTEGHAGLRTTRVMLATAHLDHNRSNNDPKNLKAFCQRCHMLHDKPEHLRERDLTYKKRRALGDLFTGRYN